MIYRPFTLHWYFLSVYSVRSTKNTNAVKETNDRIGAFTFINIIIMRTEAVSSPSLVDRGALSVASRASYYIRILSAVSATDRAPRSTSLGALIGRALVLHVKGPGSRSSQV